MSTASHAPQPFASDAAFLDDWQQSCQGLRHPAVTDSLELAGMALARWKMYRAEQNYARNRKDVHDFVQDNPHSEVCYRHRRGMECPAHLGGGDTEFFRVLHEEADRNEMAREFGYADVVSEELSRRFWKRK